MKKRMAMENQGLIKGGREVERYRLGDSGMETDVLNGKGEEAGGEGEEER